MRISPDLWLLVDPDPQTQAELAALMESDPDEVERRFCGLLRFGTAGIRGRLGAGPMRMNRVLIRSVTAAVGQTLRREVGQDAPIRIVIGHDARHNSAEFAEDAARVLAGMGISVDLLAEPQPTPLVVFARTFLNADAAIVITASHNPATDNGYKLYWTDGIQIAPPVDSTIANTISELGIYDPELLAAADDPLIQRPGDEIATAYIDSRIELVGASPDRELRTVYSAMHGVGKELAQTMMNQCGFTDFIVVPEQAEPDPDFPTAPFPNPEEHGTLDLAIRLAEQQEADIIFANDPDADRLAVAVPDEGGWRRLTGNEIGVLLAEHILGRETGNDRLVVTTVVSSRLLEKIAAEHRVRYAETLTGFKWIMRPALDDPTSRFVFGYEEALGFAFDDVVRDKDGITAMALFADLAAQLKTSGETVLGRLESIFVRHGVHLTRQVSIRSSEAGQAMRLLRSGPPKTIGGVPILSFDDLLEEKGGLAPTDALVMKTERARVVFRPSGTEPKLKIYAEITSPPGQPVTDALERCRTELDEVLDSACEEVQRRTSVTEGPSDRPVTAP